MTKEQIRQCADIIRESVSARDYASLIGLQVNRAGFAKCPFHAGDHDASLKLYDGRKGFHCFGCGASGDVIELAKRYYGLNFPQAIAKVAEDTGTALPGAGSMTYDQVKAMCKAESRREELKRQEAIRDKIEEKYWTALDEYLAAERELEQISDEEWETVKAEALSIPITEEDIKASQAERREREQRIRDRILKGTKFSLLNMKPKPIAEYESNSDCGISDRLVNAINKRNAAKNRLDYYTNERDRQQEEAQ